jgi:hypothetical protein
VAIVEGVPPDTERPLHLVAIRTALPQLEMVA